MSTVLQRCMTRGRSPTPDTHIGIGLESCRLHMRRTSANRRHALSSACPQDAMVAQQQHEGIAVYHAAPTRSSRIVWLLEELGLPYKAISVDFPNELFTPEYLKINPMGS